MTILKTKRLILRPIRRGDEPFFVKYLNNKRVHRFFALPPFPYTMKHARAWVDINIKKQQKKKKSDIVFVIEREKVFVGAIGLHRISGHKGELGYWIAASTRPPNKASMKVLVKCGYKKEGHLRKVLLKGGRLYDLYLFSKIN